MAIVCLSVGIQIMCNACVTNTMMDNVIVLRKVSVLLKVVIHERVPGVESNGDIKPSIPTIWQISENFLWNGHPQLLSSGSHAFVPQEHCIALFAFQGDAIHCLTEYRASQNTEICYVGNAYIVLCIDYH